MLSTDKQVDRESHLVKMNRQFNQNGKPTQWGNLAQSFQITDLLQKRLNASKFNNIECNIILETWILFLGSDSSTDDNSEYRIYAFIFMYTTMLMLSDELEVIHPKESKLPPTNSPIKTNVQTESAATCKTRTALILLRTVHLVYRMQGQ